MHLILQMSGEYKRNSKKKKQITVMVLESQKEKPIREGNVIK